MNKSSRESAELGIRDYQLWRMLSNEAVDERGAQEKADDEWQKGRKAQSSK
jgi:hypothetical protein